MEFRGREFRGRDADELHTREDADVPVKRQSRSKPVGVPAPAEVPAMHSGTSSDEESSWKIIDEFRGVSWDSPIFASHHDGMATV